MRTLRNSILCFGALLLAASLVQGQDLSKYRGFSLGTSLADVLKLSDQKLADVKTVHVRPMLLQELPWWPFSSSGVSSRPDDVQQVLFSFSNGALYKISVIYERSSTEGLTAQDMVRSISAKYGPATNVESEADFALAKAYDQKQGPVASWQDSQSSVELVRSPYGDSFGLVIYTKAANAAADLGITEAVKLEELQRPGKEADEKKKEADALEVTREKNQKSFRP
jgi:hypothetical protein